MAIIFSPLWREKVASKASLIVIFVIRATVVIFVAIRLIYNRRETTKASLFALNLVRLMFIFVYLVLEGPVALNDNAYSVVASTIVFIIVLVLTSVKIEYPQNSGTVNVETMGHVPTVNTLVFINQ